MQGSAKVALRKGTLNIAAVVLILAALQGCAVVGPLLSMGGMVGFAPLQYASTAYTVGEFSYEYAANDKNPSEVIETKIDKILTGKAFELPDLKPGHDTPAKTEDVMVAQADTQNEPVDLALSTDARQQRINHVLNQRSLQFERLELRHMEFLKAQTNNTLSLRQTAMASNPDLFRGAIGETTLR